ncbi:hypothetical protein TWF718_001003 [Orbilia javanica]|uniref:Uncharacterized protein n=1 Tax=Orbilia javanica TaxID=47235 RepID=A0AAN8MY02_9PEZI
MSSPLVDSPRQHPQSGPNTVRHRPYFRRGTSSQRSHSPPPPADRKQICTAIKNVLCFPICGKKRPGDDEGSSEGEEDRLRAKLLDLDSIISSEAQTKAPEGDKLPVFTRLRDWTEHQRDVAERRAKRTGGEGREERERGDGFPARSVSTPMPRTTPIIDLPDKRGRRRRSDGYLPEPAGGAWEPKMAKIRDSLGFEEVDVPARKPVPPPETPIDFSRQNFPAEKSPANGPIHPTSWPADQEAETSREKQPIVPPKIPAHTGNFGYGPVPDPGLGFKKHEDEGDHFFSINFPKLEDFIPPVLRLGPHDNGSVSSRKHAHLRKKAKMMKQDELSRIITNTVGSTGIDIGADDTTQRKKKEKEKKE